MFPASMCVCCYQAKIQKSKYPEGGREGGVCVCVCVCVCEGREEAGGRVCGIVPNQQVSLSPSLPPLLHTRALLLFT